MSPSSLPKTSSSKTLLREDILGRKLSPRVRRAVDVVQLKCQVSGPEPSAQWRGWDSCQCDLLAYPPQTDFKNLDPSGRGKSRTPKAGPCVSCPIYGNVTPICGFRLVRF